MSQSFRNFKSSVLPVIIEEEMSDFSIRIPRKEVTLKSMTFKSL